MLKPRHLFLIIFILVLAPSAAYFISSFHVSFEQDPRPWIFGSALFIFLTFFSCLWVYLKHSEENKKKLQQELKTNGRKIETWLLSSSVIGRKNGHEQWQLTSTFTEGGHTYYFQSNPLSFDADYLLETTKAKNVTVYIDKNMDKYYMNAEELLDLPPKHSLT